jgi:hypothetical protein
MEKVLFPFRQIQLFDDPVPLPEKKQIPKEIIIEDEGLFR